jgi:hypothetical protein
LAAEMEAASVQLAQFPPEQTFRVGFVGAQEPDAVERSSL